MSNLLENKRNAVLLGVLGVVALLAAAWFLAIAPQRSKATDLATDVTAAEQELQARRQALAEPSAAVTVKANDLYRLTKALPDTTDMAGALLDINRLAARHDLDFDSLQPGAPLAATGYVAQPLNVVVQGRYKDVAGFLGELRQLVRVRKGRLDARGRAYSATDVTLSEADDDRTFPDVKAAVTVQSFTFQAPAPTPGATDESGTSPDGTVAAGVTP